MPLNHLAFVLPYALAFGGIAYLIVLFVPLRRKILAAPTAALAAQRTRRAKMTTRLEFCHATSNDLSIQHSPDSLIVGAACDSPALDTLAARSRRCVARAAIVTAALSRVPLSDTRCIVRHFCQRPSFYEQSPQAKAPLPRRTQSTSRNRPSLTLLTRPCFPFRCVPRPSARRRESLTDTHTMKRRTWRKQRQPHTHKPDDANDEINIELPLIVSSFLLAHIVER